MKTKHFFGLVAGLAFIQIARGDITYSITDIGALSGGTSEVWAINALGDVVGWSATSTGDSHAILFKDGSLNDLNPSVGAPDSAATGINDSDQVVGVRGSSAVLPPSFENEFPVGGTGFLKTSSSVLSIGVVAYAINDLGQVAGYNGEDASLYTNGSLIDLGTLLGGEAGESGALAINASGEIVGFSATTSNNGNQRAILVSGGIMTDLGMPLGALSSGANGLNNSGTIVGAAVYPGRPGSGSNIIKAFSYSDGTMTDLGTLPGSPFGSDSFANGINDTGLIVGSSTTGSGASHAILVSGGVMTDLNSLISPSSGWTLVDATAINSSGQIVGNGINSKGQEHGFVLTPHIVSSPTTQIPSQALTESPLSNLGQLDVFDKSTGLFDLAPSAVQRNEPTILITHGWNDSPTSWTGFANQLDAGAQTPVNIIAWNWSTAASGLSASWVSGKAAVQGIALATALSSALGGAAYNNSIQFIGHSLGTLVNAQAINQFRIYDPTDLKIQDTLFDDAEIASGGTISPIPTVPVAWIDNYISAFGNLHPEAANVILQGGPTDLLPANFHSYPQDWYQQTVGLAFSPAFGFQSSITQGGLNGSEPPAGSYYAQSGNGNTLNPVFLGVAGANAILGLRDAVEGFTVAPSTIGVLLANEITGPAETYNQCQVAITPFNSASSGTLMGVLVTLQKEPNATLAAVSANLTGSASTIPSSIGPQTTAATSSSYAWIPIAIPDSAQYLSLDFLCNGLSAEDFFSMGINDTPLFEAESQFVGDGVATNTGFIDVSEWAGENVQLFLGLNASDDSNAGGTIVVENIEFSAVPEPVTFYQMGAICLCLLGQRRSSRRGMQIPTAVTTVVTPHFESH